MVFVLNIDGKPLMPCSNARGRELLSKGKAKVIRTEVFTIKLLQKTTDGKQDLTLGVDTGSSKIGSAVLNEKNDVVYLSEIQIRNDISEKMKRRASYRRNRRFRKTRYRQARWSNRKNSIRKDRFSPTITSKINSHIKEIKFVYSILPITELIIETGNFNPHALKNPKVLNNPLLYQQGVNYGFSNSKAFVLDRDNYKCQNKPCKTKSKRLQVHHIHFRSNGGSDEVENLITLCDICHSSLHKGEFLLKSKGKKKVF